MIHRTLGRTGLRVSEIGFGCGSIGGMMVRGSPADQITAVVHALDLGINYFDTAPQYGDGASETNLGMVLRQIKRPLILATKVTIGPSEIKDVKSAVRSSVERSLGRLGRQELHVLQLHAPIKMERGARQGSWGVSVDDVLGTGGIADAFDSVREQGLVQFVGITGLGDTEAIRAVIQSGRFDTVQAYYNLLNPSAGREVHRSFGAQDFRRIIDLAHQQKMGVVIIRVMAGGALGGPSARSGYASPGVGGALASGSEYEKDLERAESLRFLVSPGIRTMPEAAIRFALMNEAVSTVLVGFSDAGQIDMAAGCSGAGGIPAQAMRRLEGVWSGDFAQPAN